MCSAKRHVRFTPESDINCDTGECRLSANSGHHSINSSGAGEQPTAARLTTAAVTAAPRSVPAISRGCVREGVKPSLIRTKNSERDIVETLVCRSWLTLPEVL